MQHPRFDPSDQGAPQHRELKESPPPAHDPPFTSSYAAARAPTVVAAVFSAMTLHHLDDVDTVLARLVDCLKPGGILALADLDTEDGSFHRDNPEGVMHHGFDRTKLAATLRRLGLAGIEADTVHTVMKSTGQGEERPYTVFLLTAIKGRT